MRAAFLFLQKQKKEGFFLGVVLSLILMAGLSARIWNIHIEGNRANTTQEILEFLEKSGITHGMAKTKINCGQIATLIRKQYPDIAWVSARIRGTRLILTVQEGLLAEELKKTKQPCNLTADKEGVIVKMVTRKGVPLVHPGDVCEKGTLLVSGELPIVNDAQEVVRQEYVHADADIYIQHEITYKQNFPLKYQTQLPTGREKTGFSLRTGGFYLEFFPVYRCVFRGKLRRSPNPIYGGKQRNSFLFGLQKISCCRLRGAKLSSENTDSTQKLIPQKRRRRGQSGCFSFMKKRF